MLVSLLYLSCLNKTTYQIFENKELPGNRLSPVFGWLVPNVNDEPNTFSLAFSGSGCRPRPPNPPNMLPPLPFKTKITRVRISQLDAKVKQVKVKSRGKKLITAFEIKYNLMHVSKQNYLECHNFC